MIKWSVSILIFIPFFLAAQGSKEAEQAYKRADYAHAYQLYASRAKAHLKAEDKAGYVTCNLWMTECKIRMGQPDEGRQLADNIVPYVKAHFPDDNRFMGEILTLKGKSYMRLGRTNLAIENLKKAEALLAPKTLEMAACYNELGVAYWNMENRVLAQQYLEQALHLRKNQLKATDLLIADTYNNLGLIYQKNEPLQALIFFQRALNIYEENYGERHPKVAQGLNNLAFAHNDLKDYSSAIENLQQSMAIWNELYDQPHPNKAFVLASMGRVQNNQGDTQGALHSLAEALKMFVQLFGTKHPEVANTHQLIGEVHRKEGDYGQALESYQQSIYANLQNQSYTSVYDLPEIRDFFNANYLLSALESKAQVLESLHFEKTLNRRDLKGALQTYLLCDDLITLLRQTRENEKDKIQLGATAQGIYKDGISLALFLADKSLKKKEYLSLAFEFSERSKSAVLLEAIQETKAKEFVGIPQEILNLEDSLKAEIAFFEQQLALGGDQEKYKQLLFTYQSAYRAYINQLEQDYPAYFQLKYNPQQLKVEEVQNQLPPNTTLLSYFIDDANTHTLMLTQNKLQAYSKPNDEPLNKLVTGLRNAIQYQLQEDTKNLAEALYELLIPKQIKGEQLIILPDGPLATLPYEVLIDPGDRKDAFLIERYSVAYDYSASLMMGRKSAGDGKGILLCAPIDFKEHSGMSDLPETEEEIREIKLLFGNENVEMLLREQATEKMVKSKASVPYRFLHFATHGQVNQSKPELSRIFLKPADNTDGNLFSGEIYNMRLQADLVTLSACETGLGKLAKGEGLVGLSRALQYAGANNLIVSLWPVADASTSKFMINFYDIKLHRDDSTGYRDALRQAKLNMINSESYKLPYYWAPFILVGK